jgi:hypothetical protein
MNTDTTIVIPPRSSPNPLPEGQKPGQIDRLYERRAELRKELELLEEAIVALESNPQVAALLAVVTRAIANRGDSW